MPNIIKGERFAMENGFKTYYFPEIPIKHPFDEEGITGEETNFHRSLGNGELFEELDEIPGEFAGQKDKTTLLKDRGYAEGFAKGEKAGLKSGRKILEPVMENFLTSLGELEKIKKEICLNAEKETIGLALAIAEKIVGYEIVTNKDLILRVIRQALKEAVDQEKIITKISPSDLKYLNDSGFEPSDLADNIDDIVIVMDNKVLNGGCIIETDFGEIDARIEKQIQAIKETFESELKKRPE